MPPLTVNDHNRDSAGLTYVYPVISRRSGGLSIGINLNPNQACNWRCIYCQVPGLQRGAGPTINLMQLNQELRHLLDNILLGDFCIRHSVPNHQRVIRDIAISGNGEPTTCQQFDDVISLLEQVCAAYPALADIHKILITNGSQLHKPRIQQGIGHWSGLGGEVWFKIDSATKEGLQLINGTCLTAATVRQNIETCARLCPTWIQTCLFTLDGHPPSTDEQTAYLELLDNLTKSAVPIQGVLLYGLARPSCQPEAARLAKLSTEWLNDFGTRIESLGMRVKTHP